MGLFLLSKCVIDVHSRPHPNELLSDKTNTAAFISKHIKPLLHGTVPLLAAPTVALHTKDLDGELWLLSCTLGQIDRTFQLFLQVQAFI